MYPSRVTRYNIKDATSFKRDPMRELADACRRNGIRFGFYYSHAFDWEHPDAPGNDWGMTIIRAVTNTCTEACVGTMSIPSCLEKARNTWMKKHCHK